jgi:hypothetical protein
MADRQAEVGGSVLCAFPTSYTLRIEREMKRVEDWSRRVTRAIDHKVTDTDVFRALYREATAGEESERMWLDASALKQCENYTRKYCLCAQAFTEGLTMIACEFCDEWYHPSCVRIPTASVDRVSHFMCPRCCRKRGIHYKYGFIQGFHEQPKPAPPPPPPVAAAVMPMPGAGYVPRPHTTLVTHTEHHTHCLPSRYAVGRRVPVRSRLMNLFTSSRISELAQ